MEKNPSAKAYHFLLSRCDCRFLIERSVPVDQLRCPNTFQQSLLLMGEKITIVVTIHSERVRLSLTDSEPISCGRNRDTALENIFFIFCHHHSH